MVRVSRLRGRADAAIAAAAALIALLCLGVLPAQSQAATLKVFVRGLPGKAHGKVIVKGPGRYRETLRRTRTLRSVKAGRYKILTRPVTLQRSFKQVPRGSRAIPVRRATRIRVRRGKRTVAEARYGTIRSSRVLKLRAGPLSIAGPRAGLRARARYGARTGAQLQHPTTANRPVAGLGHSPLPPPDPYPRRPPDRNRPTSPGHLLERPLQSDRTGEDLVSAGLDLSLIHISEPT